MGEKRRDRILVQSRYQEKLNGFGFRFDQKYYGIISHDDGLNKGCVLNFRKRKNENNNSL